MRSIVRRLTKFCLPLLARLAGAGCLLSLTGCYGIMPPTPPPNLDVRVLNLAYSPPSPVAAGATLRFLMNAALNTDPWVQYEAIVAESDLRLAEELRWQLYCSLHDDGVLPDLHAGDGVYCGELTLPAELPAQYEYKVTGRASWTYDNKDPLPPAVFAPPLKILPTGDSQ